MEIISLFSGVCALDLGLTRTGTMSLGKKRAYKVMVFKKVRTENE